MLNLNNDSESNDIQIECVTTTESSEPSTSSNSDCYKKKEVEKCIKYNGAYWRQI